MIEEWIKVRVDLVDGDKCRQIAALCKLKDPDIALGKLVKLWVFFDRHSADGTLNNYSRTEVDSLVRIKGFSAALEQVGWLQFVGSGREQTAVMLRYHEHNGFSHKARLLKSKAKSRERSDATNVANLSHEMSPECRSEMATPSYSEGGEVENKSKSSASDDAATVKTGKATQTAIAAEGVNAAAAKLRDKLKRKESQSWLKPYDEAYAARQKVPLPVSVSLRPIAEVRKIHGEELTLTVWRYYCAAEKGEFLTAAGFRRAFGTWLERYHASKAENVPEGLLCVFRAYPAHRRGSQSDAVVAMRNAGIEESTAPSVVQAIESWAKSEQWTKDAGKWVPRFAKFCADRLWENAPVQYTSNRLGEGGRPDTGEYWHHGVRVCPKCETIHHMRLQPCGVKPVPRPDTPEFTAKKEALFAKLQAEIDARDAARQARYAAQAEAYERAQEQIH